MNAPVRILVVDDDPDILNGTARVLEQAGYRVDTAATGEAALQAARLHPPDLILLDHHLPDVEGIDICRRVKSDPALVDVLVVLVSASSTHGDNQAEGLESGADGYIVHPAANRELLARVNAFARIQRLTRSLREQTVELKVRNDILDRQRAASVALASEAADARQRAEDAYHALHESEEQHRRLFETMTQGVVYQAPDGRVIAANPAAERILGLSLDQMLGKTSMDPGWRALREDGSELPGQDHPAMVALRTGVPVERAIMSVQHQATSGRIWMSVTAIPLFKPGETTPFQVYATLDDITAQRRAEHEYGTLFREMLDGFALHEIICDNEGHPTDYRFLAVNAAFERMTGLKGADVVGRTVLDVLPGTEPHWLEAYGHVALTGEPANFENYTKELDRHFEVTAYRPAPNQFACIFADITERKLGEAERKTLTLQLNQAQKMESIGRLAGGVAHDFNNMLGVILGHADLALERLDSAHAVRADLIEIRKAAGRSADLTRQLLAFARKQTIAPQVLDLNDTLEGMLGMLRRLIGEDISLVWLPGRDVWPVKVDPSQVDQLLANLCVNVRDAIAGVGKMTIETDSITFDDEYCRTHAGFVPGDYTRLSVSDDGCGMDTDTLGQMFEPFFTTKPVGQGTGLGLATVYGIVKQNQGFINVYSEPGHGTTFSVYLPRHQGEPGTASTDSAAGPAARGGETILLVEDEPAILRLTTTLLERLGYTVLPAPTPSEAMRLAREYTGDIHLLMTDVVMPEMNGRDLARNLLERHPHLERLFMSGYTSNVIAHHGVLDKGVHFIQKPFSIKDLGAKIREALGRTGHP